MDTFDDSRWPIVTLRFSENSDNEEWQQLMGKLRECCKRGQRFAVIADATRMKGPPNATQRKTGADLAEWIRREVPQGPWPIVAWGNVITSSLVRGALTAILWLATPPHPQKVFATHDEANAWVAKMLSDAKSQ